MAYTLALDNHILWLPGLATLLGGAFAAFLAAAWAGFLARRLGSLTAIVGVMALAALAFAPVPTAIRPFLPSALAAVPMRAAPLVACVLGSVGLLALTPPTPRADGRAGLGR
jgi:hypothetical protein